MKTKKILFLTKQSVVCRYAISVIQHTVDSEQLVIKQGKMTDKDLQELKTYHFEYIISFMYAWIVPPNILRLASRASINFHPGSPDYPGSGCYNFALYDNVPFYGTTCHHMTEKVDTGPIISVRTFRIHGTDTVESLKLKAMLVSLEHFIDILDRISQGEALPNSEAKWSRKPFQKKQIDELCRIDPQTMDTEEIQRRIRATTYPGMPGPFVEINKQRFNYPISDRDPII